MKNLNDIQVKKTVKVEDILSSGNLRERMLALGLTRGAVINVVRKGPKNNLTVYNIRGSKIALRQEESRLILVSDI
ncbi:MULTISPECIES: FeoA family protein [unclassified Clostridioides]|uniref:FeoA family protein n=1 Tax=unclassified Clostridioides TaxID=2635829 RepID=UPI001D127801|nr:ferrous iron transport protein A [Clostridioides sp. ZZV15-6388]MCC0644394.1 ferrous iron transport protein A [Clostridioides sp. ZZV14-6150]MCC0659477.1 ferrous iron transport protein A [Clostridioides sp. ZZV14-6154]MCC0666169.1 ferrous iron transport protein A [Clostridioides sp. ZZV15-6597]MCC0667010.1 ferrous iron transport protein A [Clostridioides sp. ZZV14-6153]MCC0718714.1 ferrous iron transport protein A [Clostridioides sp. ZZV14-6105]MCC0723210.1 ferrous iron transport protein A